MPRRAEVDVVRLTADWTSWGGFGPSEDAVLVEDVGAWQRTGLVGRQMLHADGAFVSLVVAVHVGCLCLSC